MSILTEPSSVSLLVIVHDRIHVVDGSKFFSSPLEITKDFVCWVAGVEAEAFPLADEQLRSNGLKLVVHGGDFGFVDMALLFCEGEELLFWAGWDYCVRLPSDMEFPSIWFVDFGIIHVPVRHFQFLGNLNRRGLSILIANLDI